MATSEEYKAYVMDLLNPLLSVRARKMFGGVGVYADEVMFGLISSEDVLYFRTMDSNRDDYLSADMSQFKHMPYYEVPADVLDDSDLLKIWADKSVAAAQEAKQKKGKK